MNIKTYDEYDKKCAEKYKELLDKLKPVTMNTTLQELADILDTSVVIVIGQNASGCDVVNLSDELFTEWTW